MKLPSTLPHGCLSTPSGASARPVLSSASLPNPNGISLFGGLSESEDAHIHSLAVRERIPAHCYLLHLGRQSPCVYVLLTGAVRVFIKRTGRPQVTLNLLGPGEVLGELSAIDGLHQSAHVVTTEKSEVLCLPQEAFCGCLEGMPTLSRNLVCILARRLRRITSHTEALATLNVPGRVAHQLLAFAEDYGQLTAAGDMQIPLRLTCSELAGLVGASREHVSHALNAFKRAQYMSSGTQHRILLHDIPALRRQCD